MKIIVANPPWPGEGYGTRSNIRWPHRRGDKVLTFPVYLAYTISVLKKEGFDVKGLDAVDKELGISGFVKEVKKQGADVVIMEVCTPSTMYDLECAEQLKKIGCFVVLCGPHASYFHKDIIDNYNFVDACIRNEFEYTARDLCLALKNKKSLKKVNGLTYRDKGKTIVNENRENISELDKVPFPDREDFRLEKYQQAFFSGKKTALIISSRGCPYNCSFCLWPDTLFGHKYRYRGAKNVVDEIEFLIKTYGVDELYFDDDTFVINKKVTIDLCDEILKRGIKIPWLCMGRVDIIDEDILKKMKQAGCKEIFYGFESGNQEILNSVGKGITLEQIKKAVRLTQKQGICAGGSFVFGSPKESMRTVNETIKFAKKVKADYVQFTLASPFPGTRLYEEAKEKNLMYLDSWADLDGSRGGILRTEHLSRDELNGLIRKAYLRYYTSPGVIFQNLKSIRDLKGLRKVFRGVKSILSRVFYYKK